MPALAFVNLKGGVGKTSSCYHLTGALARRGHRVLLVDADPQASATQGFLGPQVARGLAPQETIASVLAGEDPFPETVIRATGLAWIDLLPGSRFAVGANAPHPHEAPYEQQVALRDFLAGVRDRYDLVLIDCPPNLHLCSWAAMAASEGLVVPVQPEDFGSQGLLDVAESMAMVRATVNPSLILVGYLVSMVQTRRAVHKLYEQRLRTRYGDDVFNATIPEAADVVEATAAWKPIGFHKPKGAAARAFEALASEILERLTARGIRAERGAA